MIQYNYIDLWFPDLTPAQFETVTFELRDGADCVVAFDRLLAQRLSADTRTDRRATSPGATWRERPRRAPPPPPPPPTHADVTTERGHSDNWSDGSTDRVTSDADRVTSDAGRVTSDTGRVTSDTDRVMSDTGRVTSDTDRVTSDTGHVTSDTGRVTSDTGHVTSDAVRVTSDTGRVTSDSGRVTSDSGHVTSDTGRVTSDGSTGHVTSDGSTGHVTSDGSTGHVTSDADCVMSSGSTHRMASCRHTVDGGARALARTDADGGDGSLADGGNGEDGEMPGGRVCLVGLHCCADLTPALLRLFTALPRAAALVCVGCCYHRLTAAGSVSLRLRKTYPAPAATTASQPRVASPSTSARRTPPRRYHRLKAAGSVPLHLRKTYPAPPLPPPQGRR